MSFSSQRVVRYFVNKFQYYLLIKYIKTVTVLKGQQFEDRESKKMKSRISKRQRVGVYDNEKRQNLDKYEDKSEYKDVNYILFPFVTSLSP